MDADLPWAMAQALHFAGLTGEVGDTELAGRLLEALAERLREAGASSVTVHWETGDTAATHYLLSGDRPFSVSEPRDGDAPDDRVEP